MPPIVLPVVRPAGPASAASSPMRREVLLQHVTVKTTMGMVHKWASQHGEKLHVIASEFHQYVFNVHGHGAPSNGFYGTLLANHLCQDHS